MESNERDFIVLKFGGTSVSSEEKWATIDRIVASRTTPTTRPVIICSALSQVSNQLETIIAKAILSQHIPLVESLKAQHDALLDALNVSEATSEIENIFTDLLKLCHGISLIGSASERQSEIMAFGEISRRQSVLNPQLRAKDNGWTFATSYHRIRKIQSSIKTKLPSADCEHGLDVKSNSFPSK